MKTTPSSYILAAEILTVILFHAVKIKQEEKHTADLAFSRVSKNVTVQKPALENKSGIEYMLVNLVK
jgi:hypothetical protein